MAFSIKREEAHVVVGEPVAFPFNPFPVHPKPTFPSPVLPSAVVPDATVPRPVLPGSVLPYPVGESTVLPDALDPSDDSLPTVLLQIEPSILDKGFVVAVHNHPSEPVLIVEPVLSLVDGEAFLVFRFHGGFIPSNCIAEKIIPL